MGIGANQDDLEILAIDGILRAYNKDDEGFVGVVIADGAGSPRIGEYAVYSDQEMAELRKSEQIEASIIGDYTCLAMLNYPSNIIKERNSDKVCKDLYELLMHFMPKVVYIHNLADKHPTHIGCAINAIRAIRMMEKHVRPKKLFGVEVWRDLDWLSDSEKVVFDVSENLDLQKRLIQVYKSQIAGGKAYDDGLMGRRKANATFGSSHSVDIMTHACYGMDLTPLIENDDLDLRGFVLEKIDKFKDEILI